MHNNYVASINFDIATTDEFINKFEAEKFEAPRIVHSIPINNNEQ